MINFEFNVSHSHTLKILERINIFHCCRLQKNRKNVEKWTHFSSFVARLHDNNTKSNFHMMPCLNSAPQPLNNLHNIFISFNSSTLDSSSSHRQIFISCRRSPLFYVFFSPTFAFFTWTEKKEKRTRTGAKNSFSPHTAAPMQYISRRGGVFPVFLGLFAFSNDEFG